MLVAAKTYVDRVLVAAKTYMEKVLVAAHTCNMNYIIIYKNLNAGGCVQN